MHKPQEIADALTERLKNAARNKTPVADVDRSAEIFPGKRYRDERGRMVTVQRASPLRVTYTREGYSDISEVGRREFELKFTEVES